jgi:hypothetical protein
MLELDVATGRAVPETDYERCARQQADERVQDYARRLLVRPVPTCGEVAQ